MNIVDSKMQTHVLQFMQNVTFCTVIGIDMKGLKVVTYQCLLHITLDTVFCQTGVF